MSFVLDASVLLAWFFVDEDSEAIEPLIAEATKSTAIAPAMLVFEIANVLSVAERRGRTDAAHVAGFMGVIQSSLSRSCTMSNPPWSA